MAIVENFYNGDRARNIRELLTKNFANVAKYIPNNFISLTTIERQNLPDDYKTHFKLVFDKEQEYVYRWSEIERNWKQYLIRAKDEYARQEADTNTERAFADAELGVNISGGKDPYTITFFNRKGTAKDSIFLTADNIKYDELYSTKKIIEKIIADLTSLDAFVGNRDILINNLDIAANTVTEALDEINKKAKANKLEIDKIKDGRTVVPKADHANDADHADLADVAEDSNKLGGQLPSYYATKKDLDDTKKDLGDLEKDVATNATNIAQLQIGLNQTNTEVNNLKTRVDNHDTQIVNINNDLSTHSQQIADLEDKVDNMADQIGWEILVEDSNKHTNLCPFAVGKDYSKATWTTKFKSDSTTVDIIVNLMKDKYGVATINNMVDTSLDITLVNFENGAEIFCSYAVDSLSAGENVTVDIKYRENALLASSSIYKNTRTKTGAFGVPSIRYNEVTFPVDIGECTYSNQDAIRAGLYNGATIEKPIVV